MDSIARKWRDLSGKSNWKGLLDPLDTDLRRYILDYGQLAQATYDAFNSEIGDSQYPMSDFFSKVGLENANPFKYVVTKFLYATSQTSVARACFLNLFLKKKWNTQTNWIGYVAVATDEGKVAFGRRDIVIAWRGTIQASEWVDNLNFDLDPVPEMFGADSPAQVHDGFYSMYTSENLKNVQFVPTSVRNQVQEEIKRLVEEYKNEEISITVTGHSLGAALATLSALDIVAQKWNISKDQQPSKACPVTAFLFASPRVGNSHFGKIFNGYKDKNLRALRIRNKKDNVPNLPCSLFPWGFTHVGEELVIDTGKSDANPHSLEEYLREIDGTKEKKSDGTWQIVDQNHDDIPAIQAEPALAQAA